MLKSERTMSRKDGMVFSIAVFPSTIKFLKAASLLSGADVSTGIRPRGDLGTQTSYNSEPPCRIERVKVADKSSQTLKPNFNLEMEKDSMIIAQNTQIKALRVKVAEATTHITKLQRSNERIRSDLSAAQRDLEVLHTAHTITTEQLQGANGENDRLTDVLRDHEDKSREYEEEILRLHKAERDHQAKYAALEAKYAQSKAIHDQVNATAEKNVEYLKSLLTKVFDSPISTEQDRENGTSGHSDRGESQGEPRQTDPKSGCRHLASVEVDRFQTRVKELLDTVRRLEETARRLEYEKETIEERENEKLQKMDQSLRLEMIAHDRTKSQMQTTREALKTFKAQLVQANGSIDTLTASNKTLESSYQNLQRVHTQRKNYASSLQRQIEDLQTRLKKISATHEEEMAKTVRQLNQKWRVDMKRQKEALEYKLLKVDEKPKPIVPEVEDLDADFKPRVTKKPVTDRSTQIINAFERAIKTWVWAKVEGHPIRPESITPGRPRIPPVPMHFQQPEEDPQMLERLDQISRTILNIDYHSILSPPPSPSGIGGPWDPSRAADDEAIVHTHRFRKCLERPVFEDDLVEYFCDLWVQLHNRGR
ncbi:uncharacterized protein EV422DRAFT_532368 [Fimicolochytrium jonesii]|uniref:uncharacterized protein n=1 Tax=Fimicolochytrium jonesii TaxID=1396493 RepID=UPI0022FF1379|nr:uncharacterized protein EV422DRAFT_532368 [Fimicolochytrium jonesii]KAI8819815.1 hypothetical protein EV422DRAFT_532368 [Fimicolochytrium jonesii]